MKNLRHLLRRSGLLSSEPRHRRSEKSRRIHATRRRLRSEVLEQRQLLAGDVLDVFPLASQHNYSNRFDVNDDGQISARDALGIINFMSRDGEAEATDADAPVMFYDVNADHNVTALDALGVINAMSRGEEVGELIELILTARDLNDQPIPVDASGDINVEVGEIFDLEVSYDDLRRFGDGIGALNLYTDITLSQPGVLTPILNEAQQLLIDISIRTVDATSVTFTIPTAPPGTSGGSTTYVSPISAFEDSPRGEVSNALLAFGYKAEDFAIDAKTFDDELSFVIRWIGDAFGNVNVPKITVDVNETNPADEIATTTLEFNPFLADGVTYNNEAVKYSLKAKSRTFRNNEELYTDIPDGDFDPATGFSDLGALLNSISGGGIPAVNGGNFEQPFDAFGIRVFVNKPVTDLVLNLTPDEAEEAILLIGENDDVTPDQVLIETESVNDAASNGIARVTINATPAGGNQDPEVSGPVTHTATEDDAQASVDLLLGASDPDGDTLSISTPTIVGSPAGIAVSGSTLTVTPAAYGALNDGENETVTLSYNVLDGQGGSVAQTATITITGITDEGPQDPVVSGPITQTFTEDDAQASVDLLLGASDPDGDTLSISTPTIVGDQAGIAVSGSTLTVTPTAYGDLNDGQNETITLSYNVLDGNGGSVAQTATINITGITDNQNPVVTGPITQTLTEDDAQASVDLLLGASDPDGDTLSISTPTIAGNQAGIAVSGSTLTVTPTAYGDLNDGQNETITLNYNVLDGNGGSVAQTATITVNGITDVVNQPPVVSGPVTQTFSEDDPSGSVNLLTGATDPENDTLTVSNVALVTGDGSGITINGSSLNVNPSAYGSLIGGATSNVVYRYNISDGNNDPLTQTATVTITGVNDPPVARNDSAAVLVDTTARIQVLANDDAGGGENQTLTIVAASSANGSTTPNNDGTISFTPTAGFIGNTTISYTMQDSQGAQASATVNVAVQNFDPSSASGAVFIDHVENLAEIIAGGTPIRNGVKDSDENGLTGVSIQLESSASENATGQAVNLTAITNLEGGYRFEGLAPGTYRIKYEVPSTVIFLGGSEYIVNIPDGGGVDLSGLNFAINGTQGDALDNVDILSSSYLRTSATMAQISDGGREGGLVSLDANGDQNFMIAFSGFEDAVFAEVVLNAEQDAALLSIVEEDGDVLSARLSEDHFVVTSNGRGLQFFGGMNDFNFFEADGSAKEEFANFRNAIDQILGSL